VDATLRDKLDAITRLMERAGTVHEAESAAEAMQRLVLRHNLSAEDLSGLGKSEKEAYEAGFIRVGEDRTQGLQWRLNLIYVLAEYNFCAFIRYGSHGGSGTIVGQPSNQEAVRAMFDATVPTIERIAANEWYLLKNDLQRLYQAGSPGAVGWKNSFKIGFPAGLREKMRLERVHEISEDHRVSALVITKDEEIKLAIKEKIGKTTTHQGSRPTNADGYYKGVEKGRAHELRERINS
jgi:hypothetical protein